MRRIPLLATIVVLVWTWPVRAWDEAGHVIVTELAVRLLGDNAPDFLKTSAARARLNFLCAEPDRWRNLKLAPLPHINSPDHYIDFELLALYELTPQTMPPFRYDFVAYMARYKAAHPDKNFEYDASKDDDHSREWPGFVPYRICELYAELRSSWRTLNTYEKYRERVSEAAIENCQQDIIYLMGLLSHYVGDCSQPLHTTKHFNGWVGDNPHGYTTSPKFHAVIDGGVIDAGRIRSQDLFERLPSGLRKIDETKLFPEVIAYSLEAFGEVEHTYQLEKQGAFRPGSDSFPEGKRFVEDRLCAGAVMLASLWEATRHDPGIDAYREKQFQTAP
jgi:hypothetical protein